MTKIPVRTRKFRIFLSRRRPIVIFPRILLDLDTVYSIRNLRGTTKYPSDSQIGTAKVLERIADEIFIMFKHHPSDTHFLMITLVLVLLLGIPTFHTLTESEELSVEQLSGRPLESSRRPASVPDRVESRVQTHSSLSTIADFDLSCAKKKLSLYKVSGSLIQLQGKNCLKKPSDIEIMNRSNGYTASVFQKGSEKYQTDLIQLQKGDNEIVIRYEASGKSMEEVVHIHASDEI